MKVQKTREAIIDSSINLFNKRLASNVSTVQIASELGISPGNLYYYFNNKEEIIRCILKERMIPDLEELFNTESDIMSTAQLLILIGKISSHFEKYSFYYNEKYVLEFNDENLSEMAGKNYEDKLALLMMKMINNYQCQGMLIDISEEDKLLAVEALWATVCMAAIYFSGQSRGGRDPLIAETWKQRFILILERLLKDEYRTQLRTQAHNAGITVNDYYKYMSNMYNG